MGHVSDRRFGPLQGLGFARLVLSHPFVSRLQPCLHDVRTDQILDESADSPRTNDFAKSSVNLFVDSDGQLLLHRVPSKSLHVDYTYRMSTSTAVTGSVSLTAALSAN